MGFLGRVEGGGGLADAAVSGKAEDFAELVVVADDALVLGIADADRRIGHEGLVFDDGPVGEGQRAMDVVFQG